MHNNLRKNDDIAFKGGSISVIIPVYNEENNIKPLIQKLAYTFKRNNILYELIFIDDHSTDKSRKILRKLKQKYPVIFRFKKGQKGKAQSLIEGFKVARYNIVGFIDADLQYPPGAIPSMMRLLGKEYDVVVANRKQYQVAAWRKVGSTIYRTIFGKILHGFTCDIQSGLKVFRKEILARGHFSPSPWGFDLEFLHKARNAGYRIGSYDICFSERHSGNPKISYVRAALELVLSSIKLKVIRPDSVPFFAHEEVEKGKGFHFKGQQFVHHSDLPIVESAFQVLFSHQAIFLIVILLLYGVLLIINWQIILTVSIGIITVLYLLDLLFNLFLILRGLIKKPEIQISEAEINSASDREWPTYTIFCPLYHEWQVIPQFIKAIDSLDYPKDKLQVQLLLEEDDTVSIEHVHQLTIPSYVQIVIVPHSLPKTKPKATNYGLKFATGKYSVIYDAEDMPDPLQLKKTVLAFEKSSKNTACIQAKLNYYNPHQNLLTRVFTAEYSLWFDLILPGMQSIQAPIPLGGTSNHFLTSTLKELKGWDSFNVTEDCDLGIRLAKYGYLTAIVDSTTMEEANSDVKNWFNQRSRWIKGYIQTYLVHMRSPQYFLRSGRKMNFVNFQLLVGGKILTLFINPVMWVITILYFSLRATFGVYIEKFFPGPILYMGVLSLIFGNFLYLYYYMIGCAKRKQYSLIKYIYIVPFYWLAMSIAAWKALYQLFTRPHFWPKTVHGFHLEKIPISHVKSDKLPTKSFIPNFTLPLQSFIHSLKEGDRKTWTLSNISKSGVFVGAMMSANLLNFAFNAFLGRSLSYENFGILMLVNTFLAIVSVPLSSLGTTINHRIAFLSAKVSPEAGVFFLHQTYVRALRFGIIFSVLVLIASPLLTHYLNLENILPVLVIVPLFLFTLSDSVNSGFLTGTFSFGILAILALLPAAVKIISVLVIRALGYESLSYLSIPLSVMIPLSVSLTFIYLKLKKIPTKEKHEYHFPKQFYFASLLGGLSVTGFMTMDIILTKHYFTQAIAGEYALLALVGKMVFYFGTMLSTFIVPFVSRDIGANRNPSKTFERIFSLVTIFTFVMYGVVGIFGHITIPILFGQKSFAILPFLPVYTLAIVFITLSHSILAYHLTRHHYSFPFVALSNTILMVLGINLFHGSIYEVSLIMLIASGINLTTMIALHFLQNNDRFFMRNLIDFFLLFSPFPKHESPKIEGKRILIFNWRDLKHNFAGGAEVYIHELAKRWVQMGNKVTLFCGNDSRSLRYEIIDGIEVIRRGGFYFVYVWAFFYYIFRFRGHYDVIIDCENGIPFFTPLFAGEKKFLLIHHVHQEVFLRSLVKPLAMFATFLELNVMPFVYKNIQVITVSYSSKEEILRTGITQIDPIVIHNGIDLTKYIPNKKDENPIILYLGRLKAYKSIHVFIDAAKEVLTHIPHAEFIVAGDGEEKVNLLQYAKKKGVENKMQFLGKVSEEEKIDLYQRAWLFVHPSMMEGWSIGIIEANACGTPVVASDVAGLRDSVRNPTTGFLVPYGDDKEFAKKIVELINDQQLREKFSQGAIKWAQNFSWDKSAQECLKVFA